MEAFRSGKPLTSCLFRTDARTGRFRALSERQESTMLFLLYRENVWIRCSEKRTTSGCDCLCGAYEYAHVERYCWRQRKGRTALPLSAGWNSGSASGSYYPYCQSGKGAWRDYSQASGVGLTAIVARTSAGALNYTPVAKVTNLGSTIEELKKQGMWFVCADMGGEMMKHRHLKGPIGLVIGNEGSGVSRLVREKCDMTASIPMKGDIDSLNASVAAGVLAYEIVRQRIMG